MEKVVEDLSHDLEPIPKGGNDYKLRHIVSWFTYMGRFAFSIVGLTTADERVILAWRHKATGKEG